MTCGETLWGYYHNINQIVICSQTLETEDFDRIKYHELWHYVYYQKLTTEQQTKWNIISEGSTGFISGNATISREEDFAETFAYIALWVKGSNNNQVRKKIKFIKQVMKGIR